MRWILWIFVVLSGILILITMIGYLLPKEHTVTRETRFHQPPKVLWKTITDIDDMPAWRQGLKSVKRLPDKNGLPAWVETLDSGIIPLETVASQPPSKLVVRIADPKLPFGGTWTYEITPLSSGSNLLIREDGEIYNPLFRFLARFVFGYTATIDAYLKSVSKKFGEEVQVGN
jgi:Polyketide cyclase / dehydrase and lipid transport